MITVNLTVKLTDEHQVFHFEKMIRNELTDQNVIDFKILPDTKNLYDTDTNFQKIVKGVKDAQRVRDIYINEHNH